MQNRRMESNFFKLLQAAYGRRNSVSHASGYFFNFSLGSDEAIFLSVCGCGKLRFFRLVLFFFFFPAKSHFR